VSLIALTPSAVVSPPHDAATAANHFDTRHYPSPVIGSPAVRRPPIISHDQKAPNAGDHRPHRAVRLNGSTTRTNLSYNTSAAFAGAARVTATVQWVAEGDAGAVAGWRCPLMKILSNVEPMVAYVLDSRV
jgi:hypothetical protein